MNRRTFLASACAGFCLLAVRPGHAQRPAAQAQTPEDMVRWIYAEAVKTSKAGGQNGGTIFGGKGPIRKLFSTGFLRDWDAAQARLKKSGDTGLDFDPVSNSQDPDIGRMEFAVENSSESRAGIAVTFSPKSDPKGKPATVSYDFVKEKDAWKIDDIRGSVESDPWAMRKLMKEWK